MKLVRPHVLKHWPDPRFWQWWWRDVARGETKVALASLGALLVLLTGFFGAQRLARGEEPATITTKRVVTIVRTSTSAGGAEHGAASVVPQVVTELETVTQPPRTDVVTIGDEGRTVVVRRPAERVVVTKPRKTLTRAVTVPGRDRVVTRVRTDTVVQTATADRAVTVTGPGGTQTVRQDVTGPTVTRTHVETVTQPITVTETQVETITEPVTVTVTSPLTITITLPGSPGG